MNEFHLESIIYKEYKLIVKNTIPQRRINDKNHLDYECLIILIYFGGIFLRQEN